MANNESIAVIVLAFCLFSFVDNSTAELTWLPLPGTFVNVTVSRATPVVAYDLLIVGIYYPAYIIAVTHSAGTLLWSTRLDPAPLGLVTASGTVYRGSEDSMLKPVGQLYIAPTEVHQCQDRQNNGTRPPSKPDEYFGPDIHFDSLLAFDLNSGRIV
ncbi:hypothetical protein SASPL_107736 [Salvia splendens]|uniref:Polyvinyl alcohol dehydrogenase (Cytochrome) n=1 Tax=Salvia splendens TaxID=180675 RepID=A0A8X8YE07_SALSN|nr:hypothetical protein SASPL_107736 [Salvia splendens]